MKHFRFTAMLMAACIAVAADAHSLTGKWTGTLNAGMQKMTLVIRIADEAHAWLDSPDQMALDIACDSINLTPTTAYLRIKRFGMALNLSLNAETNTLEGSFQQGLARLPIAFDFADSNPYLNRPQTPVPPFPYEEREVTFSSQGATLAGTLTLPKGKKGLTAVVLVTGSGTQNRDEELMGHKPFAVIADYLTRQGIAVLRYDDRGAGASSAGSIDNTTLDFADDALAAVRYLRSVPEINKKKIGIAGHSEGGEIAVMLAAEHSREVAFIVSIAGPVVKGSDLLLRQGEDLAKAGKGTFGDAEKAKMMRVYAAIDSIHDTDALRSRLTQILREGATPAQLLGIDKQVAALTTPWYTHFVRYNPIIHLQQVRCPMLAIYGGHDVQVSLEQNSTVLKNVYQGKRLKQLLYPAHNHLMQHCSQPGIDYGNIDQTIDPIVLEDMAEWIKKQ